MGWRQRLADRHVKLVILTEGCGGHWLVVGLVLASNSAALLARDPSIVWQASLVANIAIITVVVITGIFVLLKHEVLGFEDVHWNQGKPDIVETSAAAPPAAH